MAELGIMQGAFDDNGVSRGMDQVLGLSLKEYGPDGCVAELTITEQLLQPMGITHGGAYCAVVESVASVSAQVWLGDRGNIVGVNNNTDFLRAVPPGTHLTARSTPIHRGKSQQLWAVAITDDDDRLVARGQVRIQNMTAK